MKQMYDDSLEKRDTCENWSLKYLGIDLSSVLSWSFHAELIRMILIIHSLFKLIIFVHAVRTADEGSHTETSFK